MLIKTHGIEINLPEDEPNHKYAAFSIYKEIFIHNCYDIETIKKISNKCSNKIIWDIGSHIGLFSLLCKLNIPNCQIHSFEVLPNRIDAQRKILEKYSDINIHNIHFLGFCEDIEKCKKYISKQDDNYINVYTHTIKNIEQISVTKFFEKYNTIPDIIKIDMEGGEAGIFEELKSLNILKDIKFITGEWHFDKAYDYITQELIKDFYVSTKRIDKNNNWNTFTAINRNFSF